MNTAPPTGVPRPCCLAPVAPPPRLLPAALYLLNEPRNAGFLCRGLALSAAAGGPAPGRTGWAGGHHPPPLSQFISEMNGCPRGEGEVAEGESQTLTAPQAHTDPLHSTLLTFTA